jgi:hypothetical protein
MRPEIFTWAVVGMSDFQRRGRRAAVPQKRSSLVGKDRTILRRHYRAIRREHIILRRYTSEQREHRIENSSKEMSGR